MAVAGALVADGTYYPMLMRNSTFLSIISFSAVTKACSTAGLDLYGLLQIRNGWLGSP
jgi:hypothetical protein